MIIVFSKTCIKKKRIREFKDNKDGKEIRKDIIAGHPTKKLHTEHGFVSLRPTGQYTHTGGVEHDPPKKPRGRRSHKSYGYKKKNIEESEETCHYDKCSIGNNNKEDFLYCKSCGRTFHAQCCEPPLSQKIVNMYTYWYCNECKVCNGCGSNVDENKMLICDICDRAFHLNCMTPKMTEIPPNEWYCSDCTTCSGCRGTLTTEQNFPNVEANVAENNKLYCSSCLSKS